MGQQKVITIGQGQTIFRQGEQGGDLYFVKSGEIELTVRNEQGDHATIATLGPRSVLGSMAFLEGQPRSATAIAKTEVQAVVVTPGQREKLLKEVPAWLSVLIKDLSSNLRRGNEELAQLTTENEMLRKRVKLLKRQLKEAGEATADPDDAELSGKAPVKAS